MAARNANSVFFLLLITTLLNDSSCTFIANAYNKPFKVIWNVPTFQCQSKNVHFEELHKKYGIVANTGDTFKGDKMVIMYDPGYFPAIFDDATTGNRYLRNGGVPQKGSLSDHLQMFAENVRMDFPNVSFDGLAVIDFESWRPIYSQNWASLLPYRALSEDLVYEEHPDWSAALIKHTAEARFERAGRAFVEDTIAMGKVMRPNATWGYYAYPYCYNMQSAEHIPDCTQSVMDDNDRLHWMFNVSDSLHPSLYFPQSLTVEQRKQLMEGRLYESIRVKGQFAQNKRIYPYWWFAYRDTKNYLLAEDVHNSLMLFTMYGMDGMIIWGSSDDVNTRIKCENLYNYVDLVLGPAVQKFIS